MTMLLASVVGSQEAELAIAHGADIVDFKDPAKGALGALEPSIVRDAVEAIAGRRPASAVTGDLPMETAVVAAAVERMAVTGVDYVKVGLFPGPQREDCVRGLAALARRTKIVGVMFADREPDNDLISIMAESGFAGAMMDTAGKGGGRLLDHAELSTIRRFVLACRAHGLFAGLAGSLEAADVPRLLLLDPDYLGFRGALCARHDRKGVLDPAALDLIRGLIPEDPRRAKADSAETPAADYWLTAARGYSGEPARDSATGDRLLVHDFELAVRIGAYENERATPQRVRFNVDADITRASQPARDMRDVVSYDIITDGIRLIAAEGHIALVETLAERIANFVLSHRRVQRVTVRVEKLDIGPGRVGIEIRRERSAAVAKVYQLFPSAAGNGGAAK